MVEELEEENLFRFQFTIGLDGLLREMSAFELIKSCEQSLILLYQLLNLARTFK